METYPVLVASLAALAGCQPLADPDVSLLFSLVVPLLGFGFFGTVAVYWLRRKSLAAWDLSRTETAPAAIRPTVIIAVAGGAIACCFALYNFLVMDTIPPEAQWENSGSWIVGTVVGVLVAHFVGVKLASNPYTREED